MTRIQELEREVELLKEIIRLRNELNNTPMYQPVIYPQWQNPYYYPSRYGTITCSDLSDGTLSVASASGWTVTASAPIITTGYIQATDLNKMVDGPAGWPKDYQVGYGG